MDKPIKSGKEVLEDFFANIDQIENVNTELAKSLQDLFSQNKLTETNIKNTLQKLRENVNKD